MTSNCDTQGLGFTLLLGTDYENKKKQLLQELQLDYKEHLTKKKFVKKCEPRLQHQAPASLPIDDRLSAKKRLGEERKQEYNVFLQEQAKIRNLKTAISLFTSKPEQIQTSDDANSTSQGPPWSFNTNTNIPPPHKDFPTSRTDATTLTYAIENEGSTGGRSPGPRMRRRWGGCRPKEPQSSTEELNTDEEQMLDFRTKTRQGRYIQDHDYQHKRKAHECHVDRAFDDISDWEASAVHYQNNNERLWKSRQMQDGKRTAVRSTYDTNKNNAVFATGLMIGATEEQFVTQMRKEQYRQELIRQIAEQQRNKIKEKKLDLRVAATGATNPEKETDRIKQFGAANTWYGSLSQDDPHRPRRYLDPNPRPKNDNPFEHIEQRAPRGQFQADLSTAFSQLPISTTVPGTEVPHAAPPLNYFREDCTRMQGEAAITRVAVIAPPAPPIAPNTCRTPYDDSYYYHGTRDPVDLNTRQNKNCLHGGAQLSGYCEISHQMSPYFRADGCTEASRGFERLHIDTSKQRRESAACYQEALQKQMKEREECKRREKEEKKRSDAKLEAEMMAYNPWGRGGAGAPIQDQNGNIVCDLNQLRKINNCYMSSPGAETRTSFPHQLPASRHRPLLQQHQIQNRYKEDLEKQIEEKKRKEAEERERLKIAEEEEERKVAEARARLCQDFEEERRTHNVNTVVSRKEPPLQQQQTKDRYKEDLKQQVEEKKRKEAEERERLKIAEEEEERKVAKARARMHQDFEEERRTQNIEEKKRQQAETQERRKLAEEEEKRVAKQKARVQQQLEEKRKPNENRVPSRHQSPLQRRQTQNRYEEELKLQREPSPPVPALQKKLKNVVTSRKSSAGSQLSSRAEQSVSAPCDRPVTERNPTLTDTQQDVIKGLSALRRYLKKEQRRLEMSQTGPQETHYSLPSRRRPRVDAFEFATKQAVQSPGKCPLHVAARVNKENIKDFKPLKNSDMCSDVGDGSVHQQGTRQPSAERRASRRRLNFENICDSVGQTEVENHSDNQTLRLFEVGSLNHQGIMSRHPHHGDHDSKSELAVDEVDVSSLRSALGRSVSVDTVATEPWLRPGTSDAAQQYSQKPISSMDAL